MSPDDQRHCERGSHLVVVEARSGAVTGTMPIADPLPAAPTWSADGMIAAESTLGSSGIAIVPRSPRVGSPRLVAGCANAIWSAQGERLVADCGDALALVEPRTGALGRLPVSGVASGLGSIWSDDGLRIAVATEAGIAIATTDGRSHVVVPIKGCWAGSVIEFTRGGRALVRASIAPPSD